MEKIGKPDYTIIPTIQSSWKSNNYFSISGSTSERHSKLPLWTKSF